MTTVTAKQLRENLSEYLDLAQGGEEIAIIRHSKITARLVSQPSKTLNNNGAVIAKKLEKLAPKLKFHKSLHAP